MTGNAAKQQQGAASLECDASERITCKNAKLQVVFGTCQNGVLASLVGEEKISLFLKDFCTELQAGVYGARIDVSRVFTRHVKDCLSRKVKRASH